MLANCRTRTFRNAPRPGFLSLVLVGAVALGACGSPPDEPPASAPPAQEASSARSLDRVALDDPSRPAAEREQDADRKPIELYEFFGIEPGIAVADVYSSDGYNTHLLSRLVGDGGRVHSVLEFYGDESLFDGMLYKGGTVAQRITDAGLDNVDLAMTMSEVPAGSVDVAIAVRNYHDVEWMMQDWKRADQIAEFLRIVRPGGTVGIVEVATPSEGWDEVAHRLNKQVVIDDFTGVGFELVDESDMLANPDDDHTVDGFPDRHKADRYVLKFRKPGS